MSSSSERSATSEEDDDTPIVASPPKQPRLVHEDTLLSAPGNSMDSQPAPAAATTQEALMPPPAPGEDHVSAMAQYTEPANDHLLVIHDEAPSRPRWQTQARRRASEFLYLNAPGQINTPVTHPRSLGDGVAMVQAIDPLGTRRDYGPLPTSAVMHPIDPISNEGRSFVRLAGRVIYVRGIVPGIHTGRWANADKSQFWYSALQSTNFEPSLIARLQRHPRPNAPETEGGLDPQQRAFLADFAHKHQGLQVYKICRDSIRPVEGVKHLFFEPTTNTPGIPHPPHEVMPPGPTQPGRWLPLADQAEIEDLMAVHGYNPIHICMGRRRLQSPELERPVREHILQSARRFAEDFPGLELHFLIGICDHPSPFLLYQCFGVPTDMTDTHLRVFRLTRALDALQRNHPQGPQEMSAALQVTFARLQRWFAEATAPAVPAAIPAHVLRPVQVSYNPVAPAQAELRVTQEQYQAAINQRTEELPSHRQRLVQRLDALQGRNQQRSLWELPHIRPDERAADAARPRAEELACLARANYLDDLSQSPGWAELQTILSRHPQLSYVIHGNPPPRSSINEAWPEEPGCWLAPDFVDRWIAVITAADYDIQQLADCQRLKRRSDRLHMTLTSTLRLEFIAELQAFEAECPNLNLYQSAVGILIYLRGTYLAIPSEIARNPRVASIRAGPNVFTQQCISWRRNPGTIAIPPYTHECIACKLTSPIAQPCRKCEDSNKTFHCLTFKCIQKHVLAQHPDCWVCFHCEHVLNRADTPPTRSCDLCQATFCSSDSCKEQNHARFCEWQRCVACATAFKTADGLTCDLCPVLRCSRACLEAHGEEKHSYGPKPPGEGLTCVSCLTAMKQMMLKPCNHIPCCEKCTSDLLQSHSCCPVCRTPIEGQERVFI